jgi:PRTRC genetic system protein C
MARIFKYQDQTWEDPGEGFTNEDVRKHLTQFFPELAQATIETKDMDDGSTEVRFVKKAGTKGQGCVYCGAPVYCETTNPPMCEKHYEIALLASRCERQGYAITPETVIQRMKAATFAVWHIAEAEVAGLLAGMAIVQA